MWMCYNPHLPRSIALARSPPELRPARQPPKAPSYDLLLRGLSYKRTTGIYPLSLLYTGWLSKGLCLSSRHLQFSSSEEFYSLVAARAHQLRLSPGQYARLVLLWAMRDESGLTEDIMRRVKVEDSTERRHAAHARRFDEARARAGRFGLTKEEAYGTLMDAGGSPFLAGYRED